MEEKMLFSSEFSGYKKSEVIEYIGKMDRNAQTKIKELEKKLEQANEKIALLENKKMPKECETSVEKAKQEAKQIIEQAQQKAKEIVEASKEELNKNLSKTKYLYNRQNSVKKEIAEVKKTIDKIFESLDIDAEEKE